MGHAPRFSRPGYRLQIHRHVAMLSDAPPDAPSDRTAGMRDTHGVPVLGTYLNVPTEGTPHPPWASSSLSLSLTVLQELPSCRVVFSCTMSIVLKVFSRPCPGSDGDPRVALVKPYPELGARRVTMLSGVSATQIISCVSHLRRLDSIAHSISLKLCCVLVPSP